MREEARQPEAWATLPPPPPVIELPPVHLRFHRLFKGDPDLGLVPAYAFRILDPESREVGHISFRVGETDHVRRYAGHIGYEIMEPFRGHSYAYHACRALGPFVRSFYEEVIITSDPDNAASLRTIEKLNAEYIDEVRVVTGDPHYARGSRTKRRYRWRPVE